MIAIEKKALPNVQPLKRAKKKANSKSYHAFQLGQDEILNSQLELARLAIVSNNQVGFLEEVSHA